MEKMQQVELMMLNLPTLVIEEILLHLNLQDRKNIRLTCKRLYKLCNSTRICMTEKIIWRKIDARIVNVQPALLKIGRSCYNLVIDFASYDYDMGSRERSIILKFFKVNGAKMRSLVIKNFYFCEEFLEPVITACEDLRSLTLSLITPILSPSLDCFTLEPNTITRPTVTYLKLVLPEHQPSKYFHRLLSVFPNVKQLKISFEEDFLDETVGKLNLETAQECSAVFDDIMKCCSNLETLKLNIPLSQLSAKGSLFPEALSNLKDLSINFNLDETLKEPEKLYSCFSNLVSLKLRNCTSFQLVRVLKNTQLKCLVITSSPMAMVLNEESLKALVSSKLKILRLEGYGIDSLPMTVLDLPLEANTSVTDLYLDIRILPSASSLLPFSMYFRGLVHLTIADPTDVILQCIFQYQQNLRSLVLSRCSNCSAEGFCGSKDGRLKYAINNLQKLEHLSIGNILFEIRASDEFKNVLNFPSLEYLCIHGRKIGDFRGEQRYAEARPYLYKNLSHLRALRIQECVKPSQETISSLFKNLKHLNYLRIDTPDCNGRMTKVVFINCKEFSIYIEDDKYNHLLGDKEFSVNIVDFQDDYPSGVSYYDKKLDRIVMLNDYTRKKLSFPKISSYEIKWINA